MKDGGHDVYDIDTKWIHYCLCMGKSPGVLEIHSWISFWSLPSSSCGLPERYIYNIKDPVSTINVSLLMKLVSYYKLSCEQYDVFIIISISFTWQFPFNFYSNCLIFFITEFLKIYKWIYHFLKLLKSILVDLHNKNIHIKKCGE